MEIEYSACFQPHRFGEDATLPQAWLAGPAALLLLLAGNGHVTSSRCVAHPDHVYGIVQPRFLG